METRGISVIKQVVALSRCLLTDISIAYVKVSWQDRERKVIEIRKGCRNIITVMTDVLVKEMIRLQTK